MIVEKKATVDDLFRIVVEQLNLSSDEYFLYFQSISNQPFVPNGNDQIESLVNRFFLFSLWRKRRVFFSSFSKCFSSVILRRKFLYQIVLDRSFHTAGIDISYDQRGKTLISHLSNGGEGERLGKSIKSIRSVVIRLSLNVFRHSERWRNHFHSKSFSQRSWPSDFQRIS